MRLPGLKGIGAADIVRSSVKSFSEHDMAQYAGAIAYRSLFALIPFAALTVALLSLLQVVALFDWLVGQARFALPESSRASVERVIEAEWGQAAGEALVFSALLALWSVSVGARWLMKAMNTVHEVEETRAAWERGVISVVFAPALAVAVIAATLLMLLGPQAISWVASWVRLDSVFVALWALLRLPAALALVSLAVSAVYYVIPDKKRRFRAVVPGAVFAVITWALASLGFYIYLANFPDYSVVYGGLGAAIVLLFYLYLSAISLLFGAEMNAAIERHAGKRGSP